jgi:hypothetical protein
MGSKPMKIVRKETSWIHTHFVTNGERIEPHQERRLRREMDRVLRENRIVFGLHFESRPKERGVRIVLECIPLPEAMENIETELARLLEPIPARPAATKIEIAPPRRRKA